MYLFYCDESNLEKRSGDFLIYGGLIFDGARSLELSHEVDAIRTKAGVNPAFRLKFNPRPPNLSHEQFRSLKQNLIEAIARHGATLVVYVVLHDMAKNPDKARHHGINTVCCNFDWFLNRFEGSGLVLIDKFNDSNNEILKHLREKFQIEVLNLPYSRKMRLKNIVGFHCSSIGQSHFPSLVDIAIGSLRFSINAFTREENKNLNAARFLLKILSPLFFREPEGDPISELSFQFSPKKIVMPQYRGQYQALKDFLAEAGLDTAQPITGEPIY